MELVAYDAEEGQHCFRGSPPLPDLVGDGPLAGGGLDEGDHVPQRLGVGVAALGAVAPDDALRL
ncbi:MAG: hypothetical protein H0U89_08285 [Acidimicrobiia bacterium]|nr:hypothetical protein [Acidimicrobiia bacterium]